MGPLVIVDAPTASLVHPHDARTMSSTGSVSAAGAQFRVLDLLQEGTRCGSAEPDLVLVNRGQRRVEQRRELDVVEADDSKVSRERRGRRRARPSSRRRPSGPRPRRPRSAAPAARAERCIARSPLSVYQSPICSYSGWLSSPSAWSSARKPTRRSAPGLLSWGPAMVAIRRCPSPCRCRTARRAPPTLSEATCVALAPGHVEVDADERYLRLDELRDLGVVAVDAHEHDAVDVVVARAPQIRMGAVTARARLLGREEQDVVAARADPVLHADEDVLEERVADVGVLAAGEEDDADQLRAAPHERPGGGARRVVERARRRENTLSRRRAHVAVAVEDPRDSGYRDAA